MYLICMHVCMYVYMFTSLLLNIATYICMLTLMLAWQPHNLGHDEGCSDGGLNDTVDNAADAEDFNDEVDLCLGFGEATISNILFTNTA